MPGTGPNLTRRLIDIGVAGAPTEILATGPTRAWKICESIRTSANVANTSQGFLVQIPNDGTDTSGVEYNGVPLIGFNTVFGRPAASITDEPGEFPEFENWNRISEHGPYGEVFGGAGNPDAASIGGPTVATLLALVSSLTATATTIEIVEYF